MLDATRRKADGRRAGIPIAFDVAIAISAADVDAARFTSARGDDVVQRRAKRAWAWA
jgi:hypothetical protein